MKGIAWYHASDNSLQTFILHYVSSTMPVNSLCNRALHHCTTISKTGTAAAQLSEASVPSRQQGLAVAYRDAAASDAPTLRRPSKVSPPPVRASADTDPLPRLLLWTSPDIRSSASATGWFRLPSEDGDAAEQTTARDLLASSDPFDDPAISKSKEVLQIACSPYLSRLLQLLTCSHCLATDQETCSISLNVNLHASETAGQYALKGQQFSQKVPERCTFAR